MTDIVLFGALALWVYSYAGYPALLWLASRRRAARPDQGPARWPAVSIVLPVHNEAAQIAEVLERILALDYPGPRQIVVVSDASTDMTDEIVQLYAARGVELIQLPSRRGKSAAENAALGRLTGTIVVNTDASVRVERGALRALITALADPRVGVASGRDVSVAVNETEANQAEAGYVGFEMWIRGLETRLGGIVGASGCLYAIRAELHREAVAPGLSRDFAAALRARTVTAPGIPAQGPYGHARVGDPARLPPPAESAALRRVRVDARQPQVVALAGAGGGRGGSGSTRRARRRRALGARVAGRGSDCGRVGGRGVDVAGASRAAAGARRRHVGRRRERGGAVCLVASAGGAARRGVGANAARRLTSRRVVPASPAPCAT
jgi:hypothetical protein